jgi:hypothetical protein
MTPWSIHLLNNPIISTLASVLKCKLKPTTAAFQVPEADYRAFGYEPNYDNLPWKENYDAAKGREERFKY